MAKAPSTFQEPAKAPPKKPDAKTGRRGGGTATPWLDKIDKAWAREEKNWKVQARKVVMRYRDERMKGERAGTVRLNMLWANTEIMKAALLPRIPKPDVRRRFPDGKSGNSAARVAAEVIERSLAFVVDTEDTEYVLSSAIEDYLLPGRGVIWVTYDPEIEEPEEETANSKGQDQNPSASGVASPAPLPGGEAEPGVPSLPPGSAVPPPIGQLGPNPPPLTGQAEELAEGDDATPTSTPTGGRIVSQRIRFEYVYWEDYIEGQARQDSEVPWKARRHALIKEEFERKFPDAKLDKGKSTALANFKLTDASDRRGLFNDEDYVEVWEVWAKGQRQRIWVARGYADTLTPADEDPYELTGFYPCPRPIRSVTTTDRQVPVPEYLLWEDQSVELDRVTTRLHSLTEQLKFRGIYDSSIPDGTSPGSSILSTVARQEDGVFLGHPNFTMIAGRGGIDAVFGVLPMKEILEIIPVLANRRSQLIEEIYQITGISDIVRGSTDPNETKGAQVLKAQFGSLRMQSRKREVQRFVRDTYRIGAELIAEHYTQETLAAITGFDLPTAQEKQMLQAKVDQLQASAQALQQMGGGDPSQGGAPPDPSAMPPPGIGHNGGPPMDPSSGMGAPPPQQPQGQDAMPPGMEGAPMPSPGGGPPQGGTPEAQGAPQDASQGAPPGMAQEASGGAPSEPAPDPFEIPAEVKERLSTPTWEDVMAILRSDKLRGYRTDVETDESSMEDQDAEKQRRIEAVSGIKDMIDGAMMAASVNPKLLPLFKELTLFALRTFKPARSLEQSVEDAFDELMRNPPPPPTDPNASGGDAAAAAMAEVQRKQARDQIEMQLKGAVTQAQVAVAQSQSQANQQKAGEHQAKATKTLTEAEVAKAEADTQSAQREQDRQDALAQAKIEESAAKTDAIHTKSVVDTKVAGAKIGLAVHESHQDVARQTEQAQTDQNVQVHSASTKTMLDAVEAQARIKAALMKANPNSPFNQKKKAANG